MKIDFQFDSDDERDLVLRSIAAASRLVSTSLDDIEANIKAALIQQLVGQFQRGSVIRQRMGGEKAISDALTSVDFMKLNAEQQTLIDNAPGKAQSRSAAVRARIAARKALNQ